jgi:hypothetical protein
MSYSNLPMNTDFVMTIAAFVIALFVFSFLVRVARAAFSVIVPIALVLAVLQFVFGMSPTETLHSVTQFSRSLWQTASGAMQQYLG